MLYYFNLFIIYSILGFILESCVYKTKNINCYSGVLYGPFTIIYGFGCVVLNLLNGLKSNLIFNFLYTSSLDNPFLK